MKNFVATIKANKNVIIKRTLIVGGTVAGLILASALLKKVDVLEEDVAEIAEIVTEP